MQASTPMAGLCARATLLSGLVASPAQADTLWQVRGDVFASQWGRTSDEALRGLALLRESASARETPERLSQDFERLFEGEEPRIVPRESHYVDGVDVDALAEQYERAGYTGVHRLPADHLANELGFFSQLALVSPSPEQQLNGFARDHLRVWGAECLAEISMAAASLFYQGVGAIGMDFVETLPAR